MQSTISIVKKDLLILYVVGCKCKPGSGGQDFANFCLNKFRFNFHESVFRGLCEILIKLYDYVIVMTEVGLG